MDIYDEIYYTLIGEMDGGGQIPNAFAPGSECDQAYERLILARDRVLARLGQDSDPDLEQMLSEAAAIQRLLCRQLLAQQLPLRTPKSIP